jgi:hypothetical protein
MGLGIAVNDLFVEHAWRQACRRDLAGLGRAAWGLSVGAAAGGLASCAGVGTSRPEACRAATGSRRAGLTGRASSRLGPSAHAAGPGPTSGPAGFGRSATSATSASCACARVGTTRGDAGASGTSLASDRRAAAVLERAPCACRSGLGCRGGAGRLGSSRFGPGTLLGCATPRRPRPGLRMGDGRDPGSSVHQLAAAWGAGEPIVGRASWR